LPEPRGAPRAPRGWRALIFRAKERSRGRGATFAIAKLSGGLRRLRALTRRGAMRAYLALAPAGVRRGRGVRFERGVHRGPPARCIDGDGARA